MNEKLRAAVIDDEKPSREVISNYLRDFCEDIEVVATASSVKSGYRAITRNKPDLVFLDIEMPDGKGFDLINMFDVIDFRIIFVTAYSEYAVRAFRVNATDYLLKPVKIDELQAAVEKVRAGKRGTPDKEAIMMLLHSIASEGTTQNTVIVPNIKGYEVLKTDEIIMCKADGYCTNFHLSSNRRVVSTKNLKQYELILPSRNFVRVHNSWLVNINYVQRFTRQGEIILSENNKAFLGDSYKQQFLEKLNGNCEKG
jgi:two-component system LytT family response regulator